jgi:alpha-methylacyl-CoA racemase
MANWPQLKEQLAQVIKQKTRDEWDAVFDGADICYAPVLALGEARDHPHNAARGTFFERDGIWQPAPAPRFSRTTPAEPVQTAALGEHTEAVLAEFGFGSSDIEQLKAQGAVAGPAD